MSENLPPQPEPQEPQQPEQAPQPQQAYQPPQPELPQPSPNQAWWHQPQPGYTAPTGYGTPEQQAQYAPEQPPLGAPAGAPATGGVGTATLERPKRKVSGAIVATAIVAGLIGGVVGVGGNLLFSNNDSPPVLTSQPQPANMISSQPGSVAYAAEIATKFTVDIQIATQQGTVTGTGIILTQDGYVLTNNHVVASAVGGGGQIQVTTSDGKKMTATIKGTAPSFDLAVIKLNGASGLTAATLGQSSTLKVGQPVAAVGSPEQLSNTVTSGIISALSRTVTAGDETGGQVVVYNGLQTDAAINPGNSGGPLVNMDGQVVAVNSAVEPGQSASGGLQAFGLGFSIPIDTAKRIANELMQTGKATKAVLGVSGSVDSQSAVQSGGGTQLSDVQAGGPAANAGIKQGDVILSVDNTPMNSYADLMAAILKHTPGQQVPVLIKHADGSQQTVTVTLGSTTDTQQTTVPQQQQQQGNPYSGGGTNGLPGTGGN
jgi:putative serine protease PepD